MTAPSGKTIRISDDTYKKMSTLRLALRHQTGIDHVSYGDVTAAALWTALRHENHNGLVHNWGSADFDPRGGKPRGISVPEHVWSLLGDLGRRASVELETELSLGDVIRRVQRTAELHMSSDMQTYLREGGMPFVGPESCPLEKMM